MRIAFLCKRHYMSKDVILDRYARLYEIPRQLAECGHEVQAFCLDYYHNDTQGHWQHQTQQGALTWHSQSLGKYKQRLLLYPLVLLKQLKQFKPDMIIGASDIPHVALAAFCAKRLNIPYGVDLYDNFESFGQAKLPFFKRLLKNATRYADVVSTTSELLKQKVLHDYRCQGQVIALPSSVDLSLFNAQNKTVAQKALGLPENKQWLGTAGGLMKDRGIEVLYQGFLTLHENNPNLHLALAGPIDKNCPPPEHPSVHYLGMLTHADTASLFNALDIGVVYLNDTPFGRYCFPQKAYEMMACNLPLVATNLGAMPDLLKDIPNALYEADNIQSFVQAADWQIEHKKISTERVKDWRHLIGELELALTQTLSRSH